MQPTYIQYHTQGKVDTKKDKKPHKSRKKLKKIVTVIIVLPKCSTSREIKQQVIETVSNNLHQREKQMKHKYKQTQKNISTQKPTATTTVHRTHDKPKQPPENISWQLQVWLLFFEWTGKVELVPFY